MLSLKVQKYIVLIPYVGLFLVAAIQTITLTRKSNFKKAWKILFLTLCPLYFIFGFIYSLGIHPFIYNVNNLPLTYFLVIFITCLIHVIIGYILIAIQKRLLNKYIIEEEKENSKKYCL